MFIIFFCDLLDLNCGPLELVATALSTEPQPLPKFQSFSCLKWRQKRKNFNFKNVYLLNFMELIGAF